MWRMKRAELNAMPIRMALQRVADPGAWSKARAANTASEAAAMASANAARHKRFCASDRAARSWSRYWSQSAACMRLHCLGGDNPPRGCASTGRSSGRRRTVSASSCGRLGGKAAWDRGHRAAPARNSHDIVDVLLASSRYWGGKAERIGIEVGRGDIVVASTRLWYCGLGALIATHKSLTTLSEA